MLVLIKCGVNSGHSKSLKFIRALIRMLRRRRFNCDHFVGREKLMVFWQQCFQFTNSILNKWLVEKTREKSKRFHILLTTKERRYASKDNIKLFRRIWKVYDGLRYFRTTVVGWTDACVHIYVYTGLERAKHNWRPNWPYKDLCRRRGRTQL